MVFVELLDVGDIVSIGDDICVVELVKVVFDVYVLILGEVVEVNEDLEDLLELVNFDLYGDGWLFKIKVDDVVEVEGLLDVEGYENSIDEE